MKLKKDGDELRLPPLPDLGKNNREKVRLMEEIDKEVAVSELEDVPLPPEIEDIPLPPPPEVMDIPSPKSTPDVKESAVSEYKFFNLPPSDKKIGQEKNAEAALLKTKEEQFKIPEHVPEIPSSPEETSLWLANGMTVRDIHELATALEAMDDKTFHYHVTEEKNEIADWIGEILHDDALAQKLRKVHKRKDAFNLVERAIGGAILRKKKSEEAVKVEPQKKMKKEIKLGEHPETSHAALGELVSMKPAAEVITEKEKLRDIVTDLDREEKKRKKSALDALTYTLTSLKPATDIIGRAFSRKIEKKTEILPVEAPKEEIKKAIEEAKESPVIVAEAPKLEKKTAPDVKKPIAKALKKEKTEKKGKLSKKEVVEMNKTELKVMLQKVHDSLNSKNFGEAKSNLLMAKRLFRKFSLGKEHRFLEYEIYDLENNVKLKSLEQKPPVSIIKE